MGGASWNLLSDLRELTAFPFMVHALEAGTIVALMAGALGWFMVLRHQAFAGHTLSVIAFPGAAAATLLGAPLLVGYFAGCGAGGLLLSRFSTAGRSGRAAESAAVGTLQAAFLGLGFLCVSLYSGVLSDLDNLLFGTFLGITSGQVLVLAGVAAGVLVGLVAVGRPLLFASVDEDVAQVAGVPARALATLFLLLLAAGVAATAQITGALLVFALLVTPAATAQRLTSRPELGLLISVALALVATWLGLALAYFTIYPVGFYVTTLSFSIYVLAHVAIRLRR